MAYRQRSLQGSRTDNRTDRQFSIHGPSHWLPLRSSRVVNEFALFRTSCDSRQHLRAACEYVASLPDHPHHGGSGGGLTVCLPNCSSVGNLDTACARCLASTHPLYPTVILRSDKPLAAIMGYPEPER